MASTNSFWNYVSAASSEVVDSRFPVLPANDNTTSAEYMANYFNEDEDYFISEAVPSDEYKNEVETQFSTPSLIHHIKHLDYFYSILFLLLIVRTRRGKEPFGGTTVSIQMK